MSRRSLIAWAVVASLFALVIRLHALGGLSAWQDETKEATEVAHCTEEYGVLSGQMVNAVIRFGQPPLSHYVQQFFINNIGLTLVGIRSHSVLFGTLFCGLFVVFLGSLPIASRVERSAVIILFLPVVHVNLVYYSQEARPYTTATFFSLLCLFLTVRLLLEKGDRVSPGSLALLAAAQLSFILSVGFQSVVVVGVSSVALLPLLFSKAHRRRVYAIWASTAIAVIIFLPWQVLALGEFSQSKYLTAKEQSLYETVLTALQQGLSFPERALLKEIFEFTTGLEVGKTNLAASLVLVALFAGFLSGLWRNRRADWQILALYLGSFVVVFPFAVHAGFKGIVSSNLHPRYYITATPYVLSLLFLGLLALGRTAQRLLRRLRGGKAAAAFSIIVLCSWILIEAAGVLPSAYRDRSNEKVLFASMGSQSGPSDLAYTDDYRFTWGYNFYRNPNIDEVAPLSQLKIDLEHGTIAATTEQIFLVFWTRRGLDRFGMESLKGLEEVAVVFEDGRIMCLVVEARGENMLCVMERVFSEWLDLAQLDNRGSKTTEFVTQKLALLRMRLKLEEARCKQSEPKRVPAMSQAAS